MKSAKIAILGGSFDPVHLGHLFLLHTAISQSDYDRFVIIPAKVSNFKQDNSPKASDADRLEMLRLALLDFCDLYPQDRNADIAISTMEYERGGVSYTSDTIRQLKSQLGTSSRIGMIVGDDHVGGLTHWHEYEYLRENVEFLICRRNGGLNVWDSLPEDLVFRKLEVAETAPQSSSAIRKNREESLSFLPRRVMEYVKDHNLYT